MYDKYFYHENGPLLPLPGPAACLACSRDSASLLTSEQPCNLCSGSWPCCLPSTSLLQFCPLRHTTHLFFCTQSSPWHPAGLNICSFKAERPCLDSMIASVYHPCLPILSLWELSVLPVLCQPSPSLRCVRIGRCLPISLKWCLSGSLTAHMLPKPSSPFSVLVSINPSSTWHHAAIP